MSVSLLLLDGNESLCESLVKQGYNVEYGEIGFASGKRVLPSALYEHKVIIYNPLNLAKNESDFFVNEHTINNTTPEFSLEVLSDHVFSGATMLVFLNRLTDDLDAQRRAYEWIPFFPRIDFTKDKKVKSATTKILKFSENDAEFCAPLISVNDLKIPVLQKIFGLPQGKIDYIKKFSVCLYANHFDEFLGAFIRYGRGELIVLPEYISNDEIIKSFIRRVMPKLYNLSSRKNLLSQFISPSEEKLIKELEKTTHELAELEETREKLLEKNNEAKLIKEKTINEDATSVLVLQYLDTAYQQEDVALFYLYKIVEAVEHKLGGVKKFMSMTKSEREYISKVSNVSYGDVRHAPKAGEVIKQWSEDEIKKCFEGAEQIILSYFETLF